MVCKLARSWARGSRFAGSYNYDVYAYVSGTLFTQTRGTSFACTRGLKNTVLRLCERATQAGDAYIKEK